MTPNTVTPNSVTPNSVTPTTRQPLRTTEAVAGFLAAAACFLGAFQLFYRPFRLAPLAAIFLIIAAVMSNDQQRLVRIGVGIVAVCFVAGAAIQLLTHHPLF